MSSTRIYKPTWLYIKQHNQTGLKYFGKTTRDPYKYKGSGFYWKRHIADHGNDVTTLWCQLFETLEEITAFALKFSEDNNIVDSDEWANLMVEDGSTGGNIGKAGIEKMAATRAANGSFARSKESVEKAMAARKANGTWNTTTPESIARGVESRRRNGTLNPNTPESIAKGLETKRARGTIYNATEESKAKARATKLANGTTNSNTPASIEKRRLARLAKTADRGDQ